MTNRKRQPRSKTCIHCGEEKAITKFTPKKENRDGRDGRCKLCKNLYNRRRRATRVEPCEDKQYHPEPRRQIWQVTHSKLVNDIRLWPLDVWLSTADVAYTLTYGNFDVGMRLENNKRGGEYAVIRGNGNGSQVLIHVENGMMLYPYYALLKKVGR